MRMLVFWSRGMRHSGLGSHVHRTLVCTAVFLAGVTLSCGPRARISGEVLDGFGAPVSGVAVTAVAGGAQWRATTDTQGRYTVGSAAGKAALRCEKEGYTAGSFEVDLAQDAEVSAPKTVLYEIPKGEGIWLVGKDPWGTRFYNRLEPTQAQVRFAFRMGQAGPC